MPCFELAGKVFRNKFLFHIFKFEIVYVTQSIQIITKRTLITHCLLRINFYKSFCGIGQYWVVLALGTSATEFSQRKKRNFHNGRLLLWKFRFFRCGSSACRFEPRCESSVVEVTRAVVP